MAASAANISRVSRVLLETIDDFKDRCAEVEYLLIKSKVLFTAIFVLKLFQIVVSAYVRGMNSDCMTVSVYYILHFSYNNLQI